MQVKPTPNARNNAPAYVLIAAIAAVVALAFTYTAGWLSFDRLTPAKLVNAFSPPGGPALGFRRNHAKGICFTGTFESNGAGASLSKAQIFTVGTYRVVGRFNLGTVDPTAADPTIRVRGLSLDFVTPDGSEWRTAMLDAPFFAVSTPQSFYALLQASAKKDDPNAMKIFAAAHPEFPKFGAWVMSAPRTASYAQDQFNSLNSFVLVDAKGEQRVVRWSFVPTAEPQILTPDELKQRGPNFLESEITQRVHGGPQRWKMIVIVANPGDPTADPSKAWPEDRRKVETGTLVVSAIEPEADGPCRDLNFDPTILPVGMHVSDDPFPAARSAAYAVSFNRRAAENKYYPHTPAEGAKP